MTVMSALAGCIQNRMNNTNQHCQALIMHHMPNIIKKTVSWSQYPAGCLNCNTGRKWRVISEPRIFRWLTLFKKVRGGGVLSTERLPKLCCGHPAWVTSVMLADSGKKDNTVCPPADWACCWFSKRGHTQGRQADITPRGASVLIHHNLGSPFCFVSQELLLKRDPSSSMGHKV